MSGRLTAGGTTGASTAAPASASAASAMTVGCRYMSRIAIGGSVVFARTWAANRARSSEFAPRSSKKWATVETRSTPSVVASSSASTVSVGPDGATNSPSAVRRVPGGGSAFRSALSLVVMGMARRCSR